MNKFFALTLCLLTFVLTSCQFSEDIYINEDGSGKMSFAFNGSQFMQMVGDQMGNAENDKAIDSVFSFQELLKEKRDSIKTLPKEDQEKLKSLENYSMRMQMDATKKLMKFELFTDFKNAAEMQDMFKAMTAFSELESKKKKQSSKIDTSNPFSGLGDPENTKISYSYNGKKFVRNLKVLDKEAYKQVTDSLQEMAAMLGTSVYKLNYHFPKPIKSVNNETALFSADRKTVTVEYPFMTYMLDPEALNLEVILED